eukprot:652455-Prymnesium_polylepis.1
MASQVTLTARSKELLRGHDWFWVVTGVHKGGGLDCSMIIRKAGPSLGAHPPPSLRGSPLLAEAAAASSAIAVGGGGGLAGMKRQLDVATQQQVELKARQ